MSLQAQVFVHDDIIQDPRPEAFSVCHGFTCRLVSQLGLTPRQWLWITEPFGERARTAAQERAQIGVAIGRFEVVVGEMTGTSDDRAENASGTDWAYQMDCIDESTNSTTYLKLLIAGGLVVHHRIDDPVTRGFFLFGMPHTTAVIVEIGSGVQWAVDSWFFENGVPPVIVPLAQWGETRWRPVARP